jgi:predicted DNA-binding protein (UPF0251 family)
MALLAGPAAQAMNVSRGTVKSATSQGRAALARMLKEDTTTPGRAAGMGAARSPFEPPG